MLEQPGTKFLVLILGAMVGAVFFAHGTESGRATLRRLHGARVKSFSIGPPADTTTGCERTSADSANTSITKIGPLTVRVVRDTGGGAAAPKCKAPAEADVQRR